MNNFEVKLTDTDEIQVLCYKETDTGETLTPNAVLYREKRIGQKGSDDEALPHGVWFEFHELDNLSPVSSHDG